MPDKGRARVLIVDDDAPHGDVVREALERQGFACTTAYSAQDGLKRLRDDAYDIVVTDLVMRDGSGLDVLREARRTNPDAEVMVITGYPSYETAREALADGAFDYVWKPLDLNVLRAKMERVLEKQHLVRDNRDLRRQLDSRFGFESILGNSHAMQDVVETLGQIAPTDATVLITGESGTGKELVAQALHANSKRRHARFVALNCAALSESILESELFGHEKGAFTGATYQRKGRFEYADGGTLFLDEVGDLPAPTQIKLLRVIELGEVTRVGSNDPIRVNVRLIAATNRDLDALIKAGQFRQDLLFRMKVVAIDLPPLRDRREDIPILADAFLKEFGGKHGKPVGRLSPGAMEAFFDYDWPGNVRELRNAIESMVVMARGETLEVGDIPRYITGGAAPGASPRALSGVNLEAIEVDKIKQALAIAGGNREKAAEALGISERTLYRKIQRYGLE